MTATNPGIERRLLLVRANRSAICMVLFRAVAGGLDAATAVAILADTTDPMGREMAEAATAKSTLSVSKEAERVLERNEIPTAILVVSLTQARKLFTDTHPIVAASLHRLPPAGCVRCIAIAAGAATLIHVDVRPMAPIASA